MSLPSSDRIRAIRAKLARNEALDAGEQLDWMDANEALPGETSAAEEQQFYDKAHETKLLPKFNEDDEDVEHHDVGLRRSALNIIFVERGEMFGTAIPLNKDMNETLLQIQRMLAELYAARRQNK